MMEMGVGVGGTGLAMEIDDYHFCALWAGRGLRGHREKEKAMGQT